MKRNDFDFSQPIRQSRVAIAMLIYKTIRVITGQIWPLLLIFLLGRGGGSFQSYLVIFVIVVAVISLVLSLFGYFRFYFYIKEDELIIHKGVINKKVLNISFDKIQTVNFEQNLIQQVFNVVGVKVDTAGSSQNEFNFEALDKEQALALRDYILTNKKSNINIELDENPVNENAFESILKLNVIDLIKIGVTQNHLRSLGLIFVFVFWIYDNLSEAGINAENYAEDYFSQISQMTLFALIFAVILILISFFISLITTVFRFFNLNLERNKNGFKIKAGLFNRKEVAAMDHKIQMIQWSQNPLQRLLGLHDLVFKQASSVEMDLNKSIKVVGCYDHHLDIVKDHYFDAGSFEGLLSWKIHKKYIIRRVSYFGVIPAVAACAIAFFWTSSFWMLYVLAPIWLVWLWYSSLRRFKKYRLFFNEKILGLKEGRFIDDQTVMRVIKVQNIKLIQTLYQRRHDLADVQLYTASGSIKIPYLPLAKAKTLRDYILYKVETSSLRWM